MTLLDEQKTRKLKRPRNLRSITPRCCGTCKFGFFADGAICCQRLPEGYDIISDAENHYTYVCDLYKPQK